MERLGLPERAKQLPMEIILHAAQRRKVYREWGFESASDRGLGTTTLSSGAQKRFRIAAYHESLVSTIFKISKWGGLLSHFLGSTVFAQTDSSLKLLNPSF